MSRRDKSVKGNRAYYEFSQNSSSVDSKLALGRLTRYALAETDDRNLFDELAVSRELNEKLDICQ